MAASTLERLHTEHKVIAAMMNALEAETAAFEAAGAFDLELVGLILRYMDEYPDSFHHPKEEVLFDAAEARDEALGVRLRGLRGQHDALPGLTQQLMVVMNAIEFGQSMPREEVLAALRAYIAQQRAHIATERDDVFPLLESVLQPEDWALAERRSAQMEDPLAGGRDPGPYKRLQDIILAQG